MQNVAWFIVAAVCEIAGCYTAWMWLRLARTVVVIAEYREFSRRAVVRSVMTGSSHQPF